MMLILHLFVQVQARGGSLIDHIQRPSSSHFDLLGDRVLGSI